MPKDNLTAFIFDMDGVLVDNMRFHTQAWLDLFAELDVPIADASHFYLQTAGLTNPTILRLYLGDQLTSEQISSLSTRKEHLYREAYRLHLKAIPGLLMFLDQAHQLSIPMALATSADRINIQLVLDGLALRAYFTALVGADDIRHSKPHPEIFLTAAQRLDQPPETCLVFEDSPAGITAAQRAGMRVVALATMLSPQELAGLPGIAFVAKDYIDLDVCSLLNGHTPHSVSVTLPE